MTRISLSVRLLLWLSYGCAALTGALLAWHCAQELLSRGAQPVWANWVVVSGAIGAMLALHLNRHRLGHPGLGGLWLWCGAVLWILVVALLCAGTLALPVAGTLYAPVMAARVLTRSVADLGVLLLGGAMVHLMLMPWQKQRHRRLPARVRLRAWSRPGGA